jgi:predicted AAA+ superfamily ATPase
MFPRPVHFAQFHSKLKNFPFVALLGPRQVGKTTLFPLLRVLADREGLPARFLILGSGASEHGAARLISGGCIPALEWTCCFGKTGGIWGLNSS